MSFGQSVPKAFGKVTGYYKGFRDSIFHQNYRSAFLMEYFVYIIYSESSDRYYVGQCQDISERIKRHNTGRSKYTKIAIDWKVKYIEKFGSRSEAMIREKDIKRKKSRKYIEFLVKENEA